MKHLRVIVIASLAIFLLPSTTKAASGENSHTLKNYLEQYFTACFQKFDVDIATSFYNVQSANERNFVILELVNKINKEFKNKKYTSECSNIDEQSSRMRESLSVLLNRQIRNHLNQTPNGRRIKCKKAFAKYFKYQLSALDRSLRIAMADSFELFTPDKARMRVEKYLMYRKLIVSVRPLGEEKVLETLLDYQCPRTTCPQGSSAAKCPHLSQNSIC